MGNIDMAIVYYQSALRLKPYFTDAYNNMASALVQKGLIPEAMDCYMQVRPAPAGWCLGRGGVQLTSNTAIGLFSLGGCELVTAKMVAFGTGFCWSVLTPHHLLTSGCCAGVACEPGPGGRPQ
jgi:hypothetical protein